MNIFLFDRKHKMNKKCYNTFPNVHTKSVCHKKPTEYSCTVHSDRHRAKGQAKNAAMSLNLKTSFSQSCAGE